MRFIQGRAAGCLPGLFYCKTSVGSEDPATTSFPSTLLSPSRKHLQMLGGSKVADLPRWGMSWALTQSTSEKHGYWGLEGPLTLPFPGCVTLSN